MSVAKRTTASTTINYSPRKSRLVLNVIRGLKLDQALEQLQHLNKGKNKKFFDLLKNAANNLKITEAEYKSYVVSEIVAEEDKILYRFVPRARGSAFKIRRRTSRLKVMLKPFSEILTKGKAKSKIK
jgi:large subunit ribosomal protein L22